MMRKSRKPNAVLALVPPPILPTIERHPTDRSRSGWWRAGRPLCRMTVDCGETATRPAPGDAAVSCARHRELEALYRAAL